MNRLPCIFCAIINNNGPNTIIYDDKNFLGFHDINPAAKLHWLLIPKSHIDTVYNLTSEHLPLLKDMKLIASKILTDQGFSEKDQVLGFHVPPFTSVNHLHLHMIGLPFNNFWRWAKYPYRYRVSWFITLDNLIEGLESGKNPLNKS
ncbi:HIT-like domain-containing protein [Globomyces pollinis-pini]|nr:HIT-like domain-containing protein [Globomyces pollinis-pini]